MASTNSASANNCEGMRECQKIVLGAAEVEGFPAQRQFQISEGPYSLPQSLRLFVFLRNRLH